MFENSKFANRVVCCFHRTSPRTRYSYRSKRPTRKLVHSLGLAAIIFSCWIGYAAAVDDSIASSTPIKIAVFTFELEDFSAAGQEGAAPAETSYLAQSTEEAKQQLHRSGRYTLIDTADADIEEAKGQGFRNCGGCEATIAKKLGADQALIGVVTRISMTEYTVRLQVRDARNGKVISSFATDLRMGANYSWSRGVRWLMRNRMLASK